MKPLFDEDELRDLNSRRFHPEDPRWRSERTRGAVLFGAGGVGRFFLRFMRQAGYEPAFFVDNNAALWGQRVEGVEVRPPEALRGDAERTVVMCTATYLKKFVEQSRRLGLRAVAPYYNFCHPPFPFVAATAAETAEILTGAAPLRAAAVWADDASRDAYRGTLAFRVTQDFTDLPPHAGGEYFLPELVQGAEAMKVAMSIINPALALGRGAIKPKAKVVIGTVHGDLHDIGKTLVGTMLEANGFEVHDLGADVPVDSFIAKAREVDAQLIGASALLTTTMGVQRELVERVRAEGLAGRVHVLVGGSPTTRDWAESIGAAFAENAQRAVGVAEQLVGAGTSR